MTEVQVRKQLLLDEYEIQHFGFSSSYFLKEFKDAINYTIKFIHEEMEKCIARKLKLSEEEKKILHVEITTLTEMYAKETEKCLQKNEKNIRNIFRIPQNILLPSDKLHEEYMEINEQQLLNEIEDLKRQYLKEKSMTILFEEEIKHIDRTSKLQEQVSKLLKQVKNIPDSNESITQFNKLYNLYKDLLHRLDNEYDTNVERKHLMHRIVAPS